MSEELFSAMADKLSRIRAEVRRDVETRLAQGAEIGAAKAGEVLSISLDSKSGKRRARVLGRYIRSAGPLARKSDADRSGDAAMADTTRPDKDGR